MRNKRRDARLSQTVLAGMVGCHINTIHRIETGQAVPDLPLAGRIAQALGSDVAGVFPELLPAGAESAA
jgi:DNA-binding XRE family transcriptional regulator